MQKILVKAVCLLALASNNAWAGDVCPSLATGTWRIVSAKSDPIYAMTYEEAHAFVGKKVIVSRHQVIFGNLRCEVVKENVTYTRDEYWKEFRAEMLYIPGYPYGVRYDCSDEKLFIPGFGVGKSCDKILAGQDGWIFVLHRIK